MKRRSSDLEYFESTIDVSSSLRRHIQRLAREKSKLDDGAHLSYFFFTKSLTSLRAMNLLWERGFFQDSLTLSRSIFELYLIHAYIQMEPNERVRRYLAYESVARRDLAVGMIRSLKNRGRDWQKRWRSYALKHGRAAKNSPYAFDEVRGWSGKSLREIARLVEKRYGNEGIWMDYEFFYTLGSAVTHTSALCMQEYLSRPHSTSYRKLGWRRPYLRELPMLSCRWCLIVGILCIKEHDPEAHDTGVSEVFLEALRLLDALTNEIEGTNVSIVNDILRESIPASG